MTIAVRPDIDLNDLDRFPRKCREWFRWLREHGTAEVEVPKKDDLPMWRNLVQFTAPYQNAVLLMFVHERTVLEKLFNYSITSRVADGIKIPLLALPTGHK